MNKYRVYGDMLSGNCYKIAMLLELMGVSYDWEAVDVLSGYTQSPEFKQLNANAKIPLLEITDSEAGGKEYLSESNAILNYLAGGLPRGRVLQWQFFEQYSHEPYIAVARFIKLFLGLPADRQAQYEGVKVGGHKALAVMDEQLSRSRYLCGETLTIADISLYAYTHVASDGGFDLAGYENILAWIARVEAQPNYLPMQNDIAG
jgi:glutathione S-transferase